MTSTFGTGYYGIGDYGRATPIPFTGSAARTGFGSAARFVPQPVMRVSARPGFGAKSLTNRTVWAGALSALSDLRAASNFWKGPVLNSRGCSGFGGSYYFDQSLPDHETMHLCHGRLGLGARTAWAARITLRADPARPTIRASAALTPWAVLHTPLARSGWGGRGESILTQPITLNAARIALDGRTGPVTVDVAFRRSLARPGPRGAVRVQVYAIARRLAARAEFRGASAVRATYKGNLDIGRPALRGSARMSYVWSDQTAPGREPAPAWGGMGTPEDQWKPTPGPAVPAWGGIEAPAYQWKPTPAQADIWQDV